MIKYAGVCTLIPTPEVEDFLSRYLDQEWARNFYALAHGPEIGGTAPVVPSLNWRKVFHPQLNKLIWPSGASRWASMLLLVDSQMLSTIIPVVNTSESSVYRAHPAQLVIADADFVSSIASDDFTREEVTPAEGETPAVQGNRVALSTEMYALEPRPVSLPYSWDGEAWVESTEKTLWLLPVVDVRWFGQWSDIEEETWSTWTDAIASLGGHLGSIDVVEDVPDEYQTPITTLAGQLAYANSTSVADSVAHAVGQRVVRRIDGTVKSLTYTAAQSTWDDNFTGDGGDSFAVWQRLAGGDYTNKHKAAATIPDKVRVQFPSDSVTVSVSAAGATQYGLTNTIHTVFVDADLSAGAYSADDFALQYATDYVGWHSRNGDVTFAGIKAWRTTGFEDVVIWSVSSVSGITTRVVTHPPNLAMLPVGGGATQSSEYVKIWTLAIRGNASAGTIDWEVELGAGYDAGTWNFDDTHADVKTSLLAFDASVVTSGGDLRWNIVKIKFSSPLVALRVTASALTREANGVEPKVELSSCYEPSGW